MSFWLLISLGASSIWAVILFVSDRGITRIWPPRSGGWVSAIWAWGLTTAIYVGLINAGSESWNVLDWPAWFRWGIGGVALTALSFWVQGRGIWDLGLAGTSGWDVGLIESGSYARRRHPQYAGQIVSLVGLGLLFAAPSSLIAAAAGCAALGYASWVEDRALARRHGAAHAAFRERVSFF